MAKKHMIKKTLLLICVCFTCLAAEYTNNTDKNIWIKKSAHIAEYMLVTHKHLPCSKIPLCIDKLKFLKTRLAINHDEWHMLKEKYVYPLVHTHKKTFNKHDKCVVQTCTYSKALVRMLHEFVLETKLSDEKLEQRMRFWLGSVMLFYAETIHMHTDNRASIIDMIIFYVQLSSLPMDAIFDLVEKLQNTIQVILEKQEFDAQHSISGWIKARWWTLPIVIVFVGISYWRWKRAQKNVQ
jgi:hypothetical protein